MTILQRSTTNLPIILYHIRQLLLDNLVYTDSSAFLAVADENLLPPNTSYVEILPGKQVVINPETGPLASMISGEIVLSLKHRFYVDPANRDTLQLTNQASGILQKVNLINLTLHLQELVDSNAWILCCPLHYLREEELTDTDKQKWLGVRLVYEVKYGYNPTAYSAEVSGIAEYNQEYNCQYDSTNIILGTCP